MKMNSATIIRNWGTANGWKRWGLLNVEEWRRDNSPAVLCLTYSSSGSVIRAWYRARPDSDVHWLHGRAEVLAEMKRGGR